MNLDRLLNITKKHSTEISSLNALIQLAKASLDNTNLDAFSRLRVANPETIFDSKQIVDNAPLFWDDLQVSGSGTSSTYNTNQASTTLAVSNLTAGKRIRQTFRWFNYQTGKSQLILLTGVLGTPTVGITRRMGQFNDKNGFMLLSTPTSIAVGIRTFTSGTAVDNIVNQADWNLDKLDGTGDSGITLNMATTQIEAFQYQWLGVGAVTFSLVIDGRTIPIHRFEHANKLTVVYTSTPNLPLRFEIENDGTGPAASLTHICASVITEGGRADTGIVRGLNRGLSPLVTLNTTDIFPLIGIRLKSTHLGALVKYLEHTIICTSTSDYAWYVIIKPTVIGTTPTWIPLTNGTIEYCYPTETTTLTGGIIGPTGLAADTVQTKLGTTSTIKNDLTIGSNIAGVADELYLGVQRLTGTTETFYASLTFTETI